MFNSLINKAVSVIFGPQQDTQNSSGTEDQEIREQVVLVDRPRDIMEHFVEGQITLLELNQILLEKILSYLDVRDLSVFSKTCKTSKQVSTFLYCLWRFGVSALGPSVEHFSKYRLAIQLYKIYNSTEMDSDWLDMNTQQNFNSRSNLFQIYDCSSIRVGKKHNCK